MPTPALPGAALLSPAETRKRVALALVLSALLHAVVALAPSPGTGAAATRAAARVLDVRLAQPPAPAEPPAQVVPRAEPRRTPPHSSPPRAESTEPGAAASLSRGLDLLPVPATDYFTTEKLTKRPVPTSRPALDVSRKTARYVTGTVVLKIWINELGGVDTVEIERTNLPETVSGKAAEAFRRLHFVPGEIDGKPVGVLMRLEIEYRQGVVLE